MTTQIFHKSDLKVNAATQNAILKAYNNTYGEGINPEAVPELLRYCKATLEDIESGEIENPYTIEAMKENLFKVIKMATNFITILFIFLSFSLQAQTVVKMDAKGNYTAVAKTGVKGTSKATSTGKTYTDANGKVYGVWQSAKGKLFVIKTSARGNQYPCYISTK